MQHAPSAAPAVRAGVDARPGVDDADRAAFGRRALGDDEFARRLYGDGMTHLRYFARGYRALEPVVARGCRRLPPFPTGLRKGPCIVDVHRYRGHLAPLAERMAPVFGEVFARLGGGADGAGDAGDGTEPAQTAVIFKPERFSIRALGSEELPWHTDEPLLPAAEWGFADAPTIAQSVQRHTAPAPASAPAAAPDAEMMGDNDADARTRRAHAAAESDGAVVDLATCRYGEA